MLEATPTGCEEASPATGEIYIPCNAPATRLVYHARDDRTYRMCAECADHNIRRGGEDRGRFDAGRERKTLREILSDMESVRPLPLHREYMAEKVEVHDYIEWDDALDQDSPVFTEKYFRKWVCYDTPVGYSIIYMDGEPIALTAKQYRKSDKQIFWIGGMTTYKMVHQRCMEWVDPFDDVHLGNILTPDTVFEIGDRELLFGNE